MGGGGGEGRGLAVRAGGAGGVSPRGYDFRERVDRRLAIMNYVVLPILRGIRVARGYGVDARVERVSTHDHAVTMLIVWVGGAPWVLAVYASTQSKLTPRDAHRVWRRLQSVYHGREGGLNAAGVVQGSPSARVSFMLIGEYKLTVGARRELQRLGIFYDQTGGRRARYWVTRLISRRLRGLSATNAAYSRGSKAYHAAAALAFIALAIQELYCGKDPPPTEKLAAIDYALGTRITGIRDIVEVTIPRIETCTRQQANQA